MKHLKTFEQHNQEKINEDQIFENTFEKLITEGIFDKIGKGMTKIADRMNKSSIIKEFDNINPTIIKKALQYDGDKGVGLKGATEEDYQNVIKKAKELNYDINKFEDPSEKTIFKYLWRACEIQAGSKSSGTGAFGGN